MNNNLIKHYWENCTSKHRESCQWRHCDLKAVRQGQKLLSYFSWWKVMFSFSYILQPFKNANLPTVRLVAFILHCRHYDDFCEVILRADHANFRGCYFLIYGIMTVWYCFILQRLNVLKGGGYRKQKKHAWEEPVFPSKHRKYVQHELSWDMSSPYSDFHERVMKIFLGKPWTFSQLFTFCFPTK